MDFRELIESGIEYEFYGVHNNYFKLGECIFEAIEDPDDGYRSYLQSIPLLDNREIERLNKYFFKFPLALVEVTKDEDFTYLVDKNNHFWLTIGTDNTDDYYPYFVFTYEPIKTQTEFLPKLGLCPKKFHVEKLI